MREPREVVETNENEARAGHGPIVLLRADGAAHLAANSWATALARARSAHVVVIRVVRSRGVRANVLFPQRNLLEGLAEAADARRVMTARVRWQRRCGERGQLPALISVVGDGIDALAEVLDGLQPELVVMPATRSWPEDNVVRLAATLGVPVLVARSRAQLHGLAAASNLEYARRPVLREASALARALGEPLTVVHNLDAMVTGWETNAPERASRFRPPDEQELALRRIQEVEASARELHADIVVTRAMDPVGGILSAARRADASLVVVGAHRGPRVLSKHVPERVLAQSDLSVLVVPI